MKLAATEVLLFRVTEHVPVPEQPPPDQPLKMKWRSGLAVSATAVPWVKVEVHVFPHEMPGGDEVMVPDPDFVTVRAYEAGADSVVTLKVSDTPPMVSVALVVVA